MAAKQHPGAQSPSAFADNVPWPASSQPLSKRAPQMIDSTSRKSGPLVAWLIGIVLTLLAMYGHLLLPQHSLRIDGTGPGADYELTQYGMGALAQTEWVDKRRFHFVCHIPKESKGRSCVFNYKLSENEHGVDLSRFQKLN